MDLKLVMITTAMVVASLWWIVGGFRSTVSSERLPATALRLQLLVFLSWDALGESVTTPVRVALFLAVSVLLGVHIWKERQVQILQVTPLYAYALILVVSGVFSTDRATALVGAAMYILIFGSMSVALASLSQRSVRRIAMEFAIGLTGALAVQLLVAPTEATTPIRSLAFDRALDGWVGVDAAGHVGLLGFLLIVGGLASIDGRWMVRGASVFPGLVLVVGSQKRAALLIAILAGVAYVCQVYKRRSYPLVAGLAIAVLVAVAVQGPIQDFLNREAAIVEAENATSYRRAIFEASIDRFLEQPLLGGGMGVGDEGLRIDVGEDGRTWRSHSEVGNAAAAAGILGLLALAWQYGLSALTVWRYRTVDVSPLVVLAGVLAMLPFWRVLSSLSFVSITVILFVLPAHGVRTLGLNGWPGRRSPRVSSADR